MAKKIEQPISEIWDSINYTLPNTGYAERARTNGVIEANGGEIPELSFRKVIDKLKPHVAFDSVREGSLFEDSYAVGRAKDSEILVEIKYEVESDLTKRLNEQEESELVQILGSLDPDNEEFRFIEVSDEDRARLIELGGWSIPLVTAKITYDKGDSQEALELIRRTLLYSGLEKV